MTYRFGRRFTHLLASFGMILGLLVATAPAVGAQDACDLVDDLGLDDAAGLRATIQAAETETGIDYAVFATDQLSSSGSNLDAVMAGEVRAACPEAFASANNVADNTILLAVSAGDRHIVVSYGDDLDERLDDDSNAILDRMGVRFADGDFDGGLEAGLEGTIQGLETVPADYTAPIAGGVLGTAAVVGGGAWLYTRRRTAKFRGAVAVENFTAASNRVTNAQARWFDAEQEAVIVGGRITGNAMQRMNTAQIAAAQASRTLYEAWSPVAEVASEDVGRMAVEDQQAVAGHVTDALGALDSAEKALTDLEAVIEEYRGRPDALADMHRKATEQVASGLNAADQREGEGWSVEAGRERLAQLSAKLDRVDPFALRIDVDLLAADLEPIAKEIEAVALDLESLADRHEATRQRRDDMEPEIQGQRGRVMQLRSAMHDWASEHASTSFENVLGHPDEADRQLAIAEQSLLSAQSYGDIPRDLGAMQTVDGELDKAENAVDLADELLDEMDELDVLLGSAKAHASAAVSASADDARILINYVVSEHGHGLPARAPEVASEVERLQDAAEGRLRLSPPDYLGAMELAGQVESIVETELDDFETTVAEHERKRHGAESELRSATVAVDRADRHVQSHRFSSRRDREAQASIDRLRGELQQANRLLETDIAKAESEARRIEQSADEIYREYQRRQRHNGRGGFGGGFGGGIIIGGGGFRGHGGGRSHRGGGWGGGGGGGFGGGFGGGVSGGWGGGGGGFGGGRSGGF